MMIRDLDPSCNYQGKDAIKLVGGAHMYYSLNSIKEGYTGSTIGVIQGNFRSVHYGSNECKACLWPFFLLVQWNFRVGFRVP